MKTKPMSDLEKEVMSIIWNKKACSIKDVKSGMDKKRKLAYTTVATLVKRLEEKGLVERLGNSQICLRYRPKISKKEYSSSVVKSFLTNFQKSFGDVAIASFADSINNLSKEKRVYFLKMLSDHEQS